LPLDLALLTRNIQNPSFVPIISSTWPHSHPLQPWSVPLH
jgi:hypothetical protein